MSGADWTDIVGAVGGVVGTGVGGASAVIAGLAKRHARESAEEAAKVADIEADRQHTDLMPEAPAKIDAQLRHETLWGSITVRKFDYLVSAVGLYNTGGERQLEVPQVLRANQSHEFPIEPWPYGSTEPKTGEIRFSLWPPGDGASSWHCRCGRPEGQDAAKDGHWQWIVPVVFDPPQKPATASVPPPEPKSGGLFR